MRSYTNIEQSKKLAEILPMESADMYYCYGMNIDTKIWSFDNTPTIIDADNQVDVDDIPCWSLAALLEMLKDYQLFSNGLIVYINNESYKIDSDNPVDTCVEMVLKLKEENLL